MFAALSETAPVMVAHMNASSRNERSVWSIQKIRVTSKKQQEMVQTGHQDEK